MCQLKKSIKKEKKLALLTEKKEYEIMEEIDIILLLSNLLNNAIEALRECRNNKVLRIKLELEREEFHTIVIIPIKGKIV